MKTWKHLACLLASYESDEPHVSSPGHDVGSEESQSYMSWAIDVLEYHSKQEHAGDCVNIPIMCMRCWSENIIHKAKWLSERAVSDE